MARYQSTEQRTYKAVKVLLDKFVCRGEEFTVGEWKAVPGSIELCKNGYHSCPDPRYLLNYYDNQDAFFTARSNGDCDIERLSPDNSTDCGVGKVATRMICLDERFPIFDFYLYNFFAVASHDKPCESHATGDVKNGDVRCVGRGTLHGSQYSAVVAINQLTYDGASYSFLLGADYVTAKVGDRCVVIGRDVCTVMSMDFASICVRNRCMVRCEENALVTAGHNCNILCAGSHADVRCGEWSEVSVGQSSLVSCGSNTVVEAWGTDTTIIPGYDCTVNLHLGTGAVCIRAYEGLVINGMGILRDKDGELIAEAYRTFRPKWKDGSWHLVMCSSYRDKEGRERLKWTTRPLRNTEKHKQEERYRLRSYNLIPISYDSEAYTQIRKGIYPPGDKHLWEHVPSDDGTTKRVRRHPWSCQMLSDTSTSL